ncbi:12104_t:CDS:2 [Gigaspora rosea]|nr:12104_t:CDS:2 [Gigaspora rosea]
MIDSQPENPFLNSPSMNLPLEINLNLQLYINKKYKEKNLNSEDYGILSRA